MLHKCFLLAFLAGCTAGRNLHNGGDGGIDNSEVDMVPPCEGIQCQVVDCGEVGQPTTLVGTVYAPNGTLPIYNAIVYIPQSAVASFTDGVICDRCNGQVSGDPLVQALTGPDGKFELDNVPAGDIPLVIQIGKWRRQVMLQGVPACTISQLTPDQTRLPKNRSEGDIPRIAIATGSVDPMECLLLKIGIDPNEIKEPGNGTRIDFYQAANSPGTMISANTPSAADPNNGLYIQMNRLLNYDMVILPCEGGEFDQSAGTANIAKYVNAGGRVFTTHYSYDWLTYPNSPFNKVANPLQSGMWPKDQLDYPDDTVVTTTKLVTSFPKGMAFAKWLKYAGAKSAPNTLDILQIRHDINGVSGYAQAWARDDFSGIPGIAHLTFNTPLDPPKDDMGNPEYCGRVMYSDFHVSQSEADFSFNFPQACMMGDMSDQEKALAFMFFDLSSCVQSDQQPPVG